MSKFPQTVGAASRSLLLFLVSGFLILSAPKSHAIIDANTNGLSDVWEMDYNGQLFANTFDPQADPDGDGWTNATEAAAGTDPLDANPPGGFIRPELDHHSAVYITGENGPEILTPEIYTLRWPSLIGKQYTLLFSASLAPGSWLPIGPPVTATGPEALAGIAIAQPDGSIPAAIFWKVAVSDIDADNDGLTGFEEARLGTDDYNSDSDGDSVPDALDADTYGSSPQLAPSGATGGGTGSGTPTTPPEPLYMNFSSKYYSEYSATVYPEDPGGTDETIYYGYTYRGSSTVNEVVTADLQIYSTNLNTSALSILTGRDGIPYPPFPVSVSGDRVGSAYGSAEHGWGPDAFYNYSEIQIDNTKAASGEAASTRFRVERLQAATTPRTATYLKLHQNHWWDSPTAIESVKLTIPPNQLVSNEEEIKTDDNETRLRLARFTISDNLPATGVDDVSNTVENLPGSGYQDMPWIMAPCGGDIKIGTAIFPMTNDVCIYIGNDIPAFMQMTCANANGIYLDAQRHPAATPPPITGQTVLQTSWKGTGTETSEETPVFKFGTGATMLSTELPVRVKVMKKRTINASVWLVPLLKSDGTIIQPVVKPTKTELEEYLSGVFTRQVNANFNCTVVETDPIDFDKADGTAFGAPAEAISLGNGSLDTDRNGNSEAKTITNLHYNSSANINIYIIGGVIGVRSRNWNQEKNKFIGDVVASGLTILGDRICLIPSFSMISDDPLDLKDTIAHEIGHIILGAGHPDEYKKPYTYSDGSVSTAGGGVAPLQGADPVSRLMCSGYKRRRDGTSRLLVKGEWDKADKWLDENIKDPQ
ncbi:MAG: hypothetical protein ABIS50_08450 [Luteolibacter sp.]|uniref:hypothetical protein n=1 Tax=Luteolibacter sp. TaxID=1962973 RepID=UPI0032638802